MSPVSLLQSRFWWNGPSWLTNNVSEWPQGIPLTEQEILEQRKTILMATISSDGWDIYTKFSQFYKLIKVTAYCLRFINNCQRHKSK